MPLTTNTISFTNSVVRAIASIREPISGELPPALYHYTRFNVVLEIIDSRALWATCAADLKDQKEIQHGIELLKEQVLIKIRSGIPDFPKRLLHLVPGFLSDAKSQTFIACFCAKQNSHSHQRRYGDYSLGFNTHRDWYPTLRQTGLSAHVQYHRVIYEHSRQSSALRDTIDSIVEATSQNSLDIIGGPWKESIAKLYARTVAQLLMELIVSFKNRSYSQENEWRIVCRPNLELNSPAHDSAWDNFKHLVNSTPSPNKYVKLRISEPSQGSIIEAFPRHTIPFDSVHRSKTARNDDEARRKLLKLFEEDRRLDITVS